VSGPRIGVCAVVLTLLGAAAARAQHASLCTEPLTSALYCLELFASASAGEAGGHVELRRAASPFTVAVTPDGRFAYELVARIEGLPDPASLGSYTTYVAWATPLEFDPVVRLGTVRNGDNDLGIVEFNKFLVLISAEASPDVSARAGPLVLRGRSPSSRLAAHDMLAQAPSAESAPVAAATAAAGAWTAPPMYPDLAMLPGVMAVRPTAAPFLPYSDSAAAAFPAARPGQVVELPDGGTLDLVAGPVRRSIGGRDVVMLAFNGQHPGPLLRVRQASTIFVDFRNETPFPTAVHWHGLRLDNRFDGVPGVTQPAVPPGGRFRYQLHFPDAGIYWYHPHHREDVQQELGLYGNMVVEPGRAADYYGPAAAEAVVIIDDLLVNDVGDIRGPDGVDAAADAEHAGHGVHTTGDARGGLVPFGADAATHALMGRFGNVFLVNGEPDYTLDAERGDVVRFFLTNASNTRTFNLSIVAPGGATVPLKLVAGDVSRFEREARVHSIVLAPAERYVVEARFDAEGRYQLVNRVQAIDHRLGEFFTESVVLGTVAVGSRSGDAGSAARAFDTLRVHDDVVADIDRYRDRFDDPPDRELVLTLETDGLARPIEDAMRYDRVYAHPVEWAGTMPVMNWASTAREVRWVLRDAVTGLENEAIDWKFELGDVARIRVRNERDVFHAMQHPLHFHGQRFLVLSVNGERSMNLVWKDTFLLPAGSTAEILLELSNPGRWMVHCHIAEHLEAGMKFVLEVEGS
jgi:suppressor of ftsI